MIRNIKKYSEVIYGFILGVYIYSYEEFTTISNTEDFNEFCSILRQYVKRHYKYSFEKEKMRLDGKDIECNIVLTKKNNLQIRIVRGGDSFMIHLLFWASVSQVFFRPIDWITILFILMFFLGILYYVIRYFKKCGEIQYIIKSSIFEFEEKFREVNYNPDSL